jgi:uncharacterized protein YrrD
VLQADLIVGCPVISEDRGLKLGDVADALVNPDSGAIARFVVRSGPLGAAHVLRQADVATLGTNAVLVHAAANLLDSQQWRATQIHAIRLSALRGRPVMTRAGEKLGLADGLYIDEHTVAIVSYWVGERGFAGLVQRHSVLAHSRDVAIGRDAVVVSRAPLERRAACAAERADRVKPMSTERSNRR